MNKPKWLVSVMEWRAAEIVGLVLGIVALLVGVYHLIEIQKTLTELREVQSSLSTRYVGKFPNFVSKIVEVIDGADEEIVIVCDYPGYADFTDPDRALSYRQALQRARQRGVTVQLTCMDERTRKRFLDEQFFPASEWTNWSQDREKQEKVARYTKARGHKNINTREELLARMEQDDRDFLAQNYVDKVDETATNLPIYFWIADQREGVVSLPALSDEALEYGFKTSDRSLINALLDLRKRYVKP